MLKSSYQLWRGRIIHSKAYVNWLFSYQNLSIYPNWSPDCGLVMSSPKNFLHRICMQF